MPSAFDEMNLADGTSRPGYASLKRWLDTTPVDILAHRRRRPNSCSAGSASPSPSTARTRPKSASSRSTSSRASSPGPNGQRLSRRPRAARAGAQPLPRRPLWAGRILKDGVVPADLVYRNPYYRPEMAGLKLPHDVYVNIAGIDIVRVDGDDFYVLEDNARTPSGVSYMLENREVMMRVFPDLFAEHRVARSRTIPTSFSPTLKSVAPPSAPDDPTVALLTPGPFNSAYYEHSFLADKLGIELVEGRDLLVRRQHRLHAHHRGAEAGRRHLPAARRRFPRPPHLPARFGSRRPRPDECLPAPAMSRSPMPSAPASPTTRRSIPTCRKSCASISPRSRSSRTCPPGAAARRPPARYVLAHLGELVVKEVAGSGGYGMLIGPAADAGTRAAFADRIKANPSQFHRPADARPVHLADLRR